jgi:prevent-host-death family protein
MATDALRNVKDRLTEFVDRVEREHDRVTITKNGVPTAVLISTDDLEALEEAIAIFSDRAAVRELAEAERSIARGDVVRDPKQDAVSVPDGEKPCGIVVAGPAARAISDPLPEAVVTAVIGLITGPLLESPHRVGKPLRRELDGVWSARRGTFRALYRIDESKREVVVLRVDHRGSAHRQR